MRLVRLYEVLAVALVAGAGYAAWKGIWTDPTDRVENLPKDARQNPAAYRSHYRHVIIHGGK